MNPRELLDEAPAAAYINMSAAFLAAGRCRGVLGNSTPPPPHHKLGRKIKYDRLDLDAWLAERRVAPAARKAPVKVTAAPRRRRKAAVRPK
jgi:uncharacterized protein YhdP